MVTQVLMPQLGEAVEEASISRWLKNEGDTVEEFEALVEVNTDKVDTEIPSPVSGMLLRITYPDEGTVVKVGWVLAWIGELGEEIEDLDTSIVNDQVKFQGIKSDSKMETIPETDLPPSTIPDFEQDLDTKQYLGFISPLVSKIATEHGIDLRDVQGSGLKGRITKEDILAYLDIDGQEFVDQDQNISIHHPRISDHSSLIPHSTIRRRIAEHMVASIQTSPHVTTVFEADLSKIIYHRAVNNETFARDGIKLTFTAYFVAAVAIALRSYPKVNSSWTERGLLLHRVVNIGMATSLGDEGLIVPVIRNADELSLVGIARLVNDLANRARRKQLHPDEVTGGTFTITNHGVSGSLLAMPIINQPQCAIMGVGKLQKRVMVLEDNLGYDTIAIRPMVFLTLTFDHRILDGTIADYFLSKVVDTLENWT